MLKAPPPHIDSGLPSRSGGPGLEASHQGFEEQAIGLIQTSHNAHGIFHGGTSTTEYPWPKRLNRY